MNDLPDIQAVHAALRDRFGGEAIVALETAAIDPWIEVAAAAIELVCLFLKTDDRFAFDHLNDLCGVDYHEPDPAKAARFGHESHMQIVYHLSSYETKAKAVLKVRLPRWNNGEPGSLPEIPTVSGVWPIAEWHERECYDLLGVRFIGHPNHVRILLPEDWVGHPLRKDYEFPEEYHGIRCV